MSIHSRTRPVPLLAALLVAAGVAHGQGNELKVTTSAPEGPGSLAAAINQANESPGATISFAIPEADEGYDDATGLWTLTVAEALPPIIAEGITIDGGGRVSLVGASPSVEHGVVLVSPGNVVRGLCIGGFQTGLALYGGGAIGNRVEDCRIGTDASGQEAVPCDTGLAILEGASDSVVTGCVISGNRQLGVYIAGRETTGNAILDCRIGCDAQGTRRLPNAMGIMVTRSPDNRIGGPGEGNVISGNDGIGILLVGKWTEGNRIEGNHIGVDAAGTGLLYNTIGIVLKSLANGNLVGGSAEGEGNLITGNLEIGAYVEAADGNIFRGNLIGTDITGTHAVSEGELIQGNGIEFNTVAKDNVLGGPDRGDRNVVSGNKVYGVVYYGHCTRNTTQGNYIGTDITGTQALPNATGICVDCASHENDITGNVISGNASYGMFFVTRGTEGNRLQGNYIGVDASGGAALPNDIGMVVSTGATDNLIGGEEPGQGNVISGNTQAGLMITNRLTKGNRFIGNLIGTDAAGSQAIGNRHGVVISTYPEANLLQGNVISGNRSSGVVIVEYAIGNVLVGNRIGLAAEGDRRLPNEVGVVIDEHAEGNIIGRQGEENHVTGNTAADVLLLPGAGPDNTVEHNRTGRGGEAR